MGAKTKNEATNNKKRKASQVLEEWEKEKAEEKEREGEKKKEEEKKEEEKKASELAESEQSKASISIEAYPEREVSHIKKKRKTKPATVHQSPFPGLFL